jgi:DNA invertase Pin-like site-specific DNA recombinase
MSGKRAALYLRVSDDKSTIENQIPDLYAMAEGRGFSVVGEWHDEGESAWLKGSVDLRSGLNALLLGAHRGEFDVVLVWSLDRITREGPEIAHRVVRVLRACGVELLSHSEPSLSLEGPVGEIVIGIHASMAKSYSDVISARVKVGMARAAAAGIHVGRPRKIVDEVEMTEHRAAGLSHADIAALMGISRSLVTRRLALLAARGVDE